MVAVSKMASVKPSGFLVRRVTTTAAMRPAAKPTEGYGPVGREVVDEGNLYIKDKWDNLRVLIL